MELPNIVYIILAVLLVVILIIFAKYNTLIKLQNRVKRAKANIDISLKKRFDLIPNIVECVKSYSKYENDTLKDIVSLRNNYMNNKNMGVDETSKVDDKVSAFLAVIEAYPELKANSEYLALQGEIHRIEDELGRARHAYNDEVTRYNTSVETVPSNIVALIFAFKKAPLYKAEKEARNNIKVEM